MAKLDIKSLNEAKMVKAENRTEYLKRLQRYHSLSSLCSDELKKNGDRERLVVEEPILAAELFYYHGDLEFGGLIVKSYIAHPKEELRQLAQSVEDVLNIRHSPEKELEELLKVQVQYFVEEPSPIEVYMIKAEAGELH